MNGWRLLGTTTLLSLAAFAGVILVHGTDEEALRALTRTTVRIAFVYFLLAYSASSLWRLFPGDATRWLLRNRRWLGLSFFVAHVLHLDAIWMLSLLLGDAFRPDAVTLVFGGWGYVLATLMALTSTDRTAAWLGPRRWKILHRLGLHTLWVLFAIIWTDRALESPAYVAPAAATYAALGVRLVARRRRASSPDAVATPA